MNKQQYDLLVDIFNLLQQIRTKGEDTLIMADVLRAFQQLFPTLRVETEADREDTKAAEK